MPHQAMLRMQPGSLDGKPPAPLLAAEHLSLRVNPNGMLPMILASVVVHALPSGLSVVFGSAASNAVAAFQRSAVQPVLFCIAVFFADFTSLTQQTPKRLAQYLQAVRSRCYGSTRLLIPVACVYACSQTCHSQPEGSALLPALHRTSGDHAL